MQTQIDLSPFTTFSSWYVPADVAPPVRVCLAVDFIWTDSTRYPNGPDQLFGALTSAYDYVQTTFDPVSRKARLVGYKCVNTSARQGTVSVRDPQFAYFGSLGGATVRNATIRTHTTAIWSNGYEAKSGWASDSITFWAR